MTAGQEVKMDFSVEKTENYILLYSFLIFKVKWLDLFLLGIVIINL